MRWIELSLPKSFKRVCYNRKSIVSNNDMKYYWNFLKYCWALELSGSHSVVSKSQFSKEHLHPRLDFTTYFLLIRNIIIHKLVLKVGCYACPYNYKRFGLQWWTTSICHVLSIANKPGGKFLTSLTIFVKNQYHILEVWLMIRWRALQKNLQHINNYT